MLSPSWPNPEDGRRVVPPQIRRRVQAAERRAMRRAVTVSAGLMAVLLTLDLTTNLAIGTRGADALAPFSAAAAALSGGAAFAARRAWIRAELLALVTVLAVFGVALLGLALTPDGRTLGTAQLAIILVGVGLFLPWGQAWHVICLAMATLMAAGFVLGPLSVGMSVTDRGNLLAAVLMAAVTSALGHRLWRGRLRRMLEQQFALRRLSRYAQRQEAHVTELNRELNHVARRDSLTGVGNRLALDEAVARLLDQGERLRPLPFALVLFDIDQFKAYNDEHGHLAGDAALGRLGEILRRATRNSDLCFRYGGEEFLVLIPDVDLSGAITVAERVRMAAAESIGLPPFTVSGGVALCDPADGRDPEPLLRRADTALYLAKRAGRNRISADELSIAMQRQELASA
ncbi:MAG: GGDEF domain-containing protein [Chloroflexota bacterium]|nr:GGDEF domain-containing protein [Chloroflexota bacterium]